MPALIPRAEIGAATSRHDVVWHLSSDPTVEWVRANAALLREDAQDSQVGAKLRAAADDLDALADRYELDQRGRATPPQILESEVRR